jgi:hypothetical protein
MAATTEAERNSNLDALKEAVDEWADKEIDRLDKEAKFLRAVQQGRGAEKATALNFVEDVALVQDELDLFISVD